ncbi:hypothetical protein [Gluconobacter roseus]|uniref:DUF4412 domain-containing protein n=1 Tax=Gluconobacter roseus NBRC 3990 TaxID=1307950 RepID=A0A4Y3M3X9_9PROT|nr:hypothetical protein [Gluconobacter roseus]GBR44886.1 hypothetical protein AA3990_0901 [Gluconobacter roseus NBRC 3990]GEB02776.1 hypothetical protein GRO01_03520 [Gluconobacter roseus NBRC 3990]GLP93235.1 hypothetical protein GCM10007871_12130 [Gluconobacter roseus NBRC 3990]
MPFVRVVGGAVCLLLGAVFGSAAKADVPSVTPPPVQAPLVTPLHDADIVYVLTGPNGQHLHQRMRWTSALWRQRVEPEGSATIMLTDYRTHTLMVLDSTNHTATVTSAPGSDSFATPGTPAAGFWRNLGQGRIAGEPCTIWESADSDSQTTAFCYTDDGLMLGATHGGRPVLEAVSVSRVPQPVEIFDPPPGYHRVDPPR